jgi:hypothetical protein
MQRPSNARQLAVGPGTQKQQLPKAIHASHGF